MNETETIEAVRERFGRVHMATPVDDVVRRGRRRRARRRLPTLAGGTVVAAAAALTVASLLPGGAPAAQAAWTVTRESDGSIGVTVWKMEDPAGLQRKLRADGIPADVIFTPGRVTEIRWPVASLRKRCDYSSPTRQVTWNVESPLFSPRKTALYVHPGAFRPGQGIALGFAFVNHPPPRLPSTGTWPHGHSTPRTGGSTAEIWYQPVRATGGCLQAYLRSWS